MVFNNSSCGGSLLPQWAITYGCPSSNSTQVELNGYPIRPYRNQAAIPNSANSRSIEPEPKRYANKCLALIGIKLDTGEKNFSKFWDLAVPLNWA